MRPPPLSRSKRAKPVSSPHTDSAPSQGRRRNPKGEGARLRQEILVAAMRLLDADVACELSLRAIAREAGVTAPSIYVHFHDVRDLMTEIVRDCWRELGAAMTDADAGASPLETLQTRLGVYVQYAMARPSRYRLLFAPQSLETETLKGLPGLVRPAYRAILSPIKDLVRQSPAGPSVPAADTALLILSLVHGRVALAQTAPHLEGNTSPLVEAFVRDAMIQLFAD